MHGLCRGQDLVEVVVRFLASKIKNHIFILVNLCSVHWCSDAESLI
jgi:hypothetical protein